MIDEYSKLHAVEKEPQPDKPGYCLPHHAVVREEAATVKARVVFDASAHMREGKSLNEVLNPGPSLLPDLIGLLLRFREYVFALQAEIRKAFFMIGVPLEDRQYWRFLWPNLESKITVWRLAKLPFGANCSPFILNVVLRLHLSE